MHAFSSQFVCLLIAQFGSDGGFPADRPSFAPAEPRAVVSAAEGAPQFQQPTANADRVVPPAANALADTTTVPVHSQTSLARAEALVERFMDWDPDSIEGKSVTLLACVGRAANTGQQAATIQAYWQLCTAIGRYTQTEQELIVLAGISPKFEFEQSQILAAQRSTEARRAQARVDLLAAQEKLGEVAQLPDETLPLPADRPFVGKYQTRLTTMYAGRDIPRQLRSVDRALPHQLRLIEQRAEAVDANARLLNNLAALYQQDQVPLSVLLGTCKELTDQQDAFLQAVVNYNHQIATYSQTVVGTSLPAESLVSTLIRTRAAAAPQLFRDENVLPAAARQPEPRKGFGDGRPTRGDAGDVRPAFEAGTSRPRFEPRPPKAEGGSAFDPNSSFQVNDSPQDQ